MATLSPIQSEQKTRVSPRYQLQDDIEKAHIRADTSPVLGLIQMNTNKERQIVLYRKNYMIKQHVAHNIWQTLEYILNKQLQSLKVREKYTQRTRTKFKQCDC